MNQSSGSSISAYSDKLFHDNDIKTSRLASIALLSTGILYLVLSVLDRLGAYNLALGGLAWVVFALGIADIAGYFYAKRRGFDGEDLKHLLIAGVMLTCGIAFFFYPIKVSFLSYWPVLISAMYYDSHLVKRASFETWVLYSILLWANVILEKVSPLMREVHSIQGIVLWQLPDEVLLFNYLPHTAAFVVTYLLCSGITKAGRQLVLKQAGISSEMAAVESELNTAAKIQLSCLPDSSFTAADGSLGVRAFMRPAKVVGGDFYDYFYAGDNLVCLVGDVSDKGLPAAMFMMSAKTALRSEIIGGIGLDSAVFNVNNTLCRNNGENLFVTLFAASINPATGTGTYVNCGHPYPIVRHASGGVSRIESEPTMMLGAFENVQFPAMPLSLDSGDTLLMFTDGLTDAVDTGDAFFGDTALQDAVEKLPAGCADICGSVISAVDGYAGDADQFDDMTLLTVARS